MTTATINSVRTAAYREIADAIKASHGNTITDITTNDADHTIRVYTYRRWRWKDISCILCLAAIPTRRCPKHMATITFLASTVELFRYDKFDIPITQKVDYCDPTMLDQIYKWIATD